MNKRWQCLAFGFLAASLSSCIKKQAHEPKGVIEKAGLWEYKSLKVCWAKGESKYPLAKELFGSAREWHKETTEDDFSSDDKLLIKQAVTENYKKDSIGIDFTGWEDCPSGDLQVITESGYQIVIIRSAEWSRWNQVSHVGQSLREYSSVRKRDENIKTIGVTFGFDGMCKNFPRERDKCVQLTALHEFGHLLGLRHEHAHPDAKNDPVCFLDFLTGKKIENPIFESIGSAEFTASYDEDSIMNYCHMFAYLRKDSRSVMKAPELSKGDIQTLHDFYKDFDPSAVRD